MSLIRRRPFRKILLQILWKNFAKSDKTKPLLDPCDPFSNRFRSKRFITCQNPKLLVLGCGGSLHSGGIYLSYAWPFAKKQIGRWEWVYADDKGMMHSLKSLLPPPKPSQKKDKEFPFQKHQYSDKGLIFSTSLSSSVIHTTISTLFENYSKCRIWIFDILAFSANFCPIKIDLSGNTVWPQASDFQKLAKIDFFWHF